MDKSNVSPKISEISWGKMEVEGFGTFKDAKLYPGRARAWDWNETGTRHQPGIQPADVQELLDAGAQVIVLSKGMEERLGVHPETLRLLEYLNIPVHVLETNAAVEKYNQLRGDQKVGGLFHSTC